MLLRRLALSGVTVLALAFAAPAIAQVAATKTATDANKNQFPEAGQQDSTGAFHFRNVVEGLDNSANPRPWYVDVNGEGHIYIDQMPTALTSAPGTSATAALGIQGITGGLPIGSNISQIGGQSYALNADGGAPVHLTNGAGTAQSGTNVGAAASLAASASTSPTLRAAPAWATSYNCRAVGSAAYTLNLVETLAGGSSVVVNSTGATPVPANTPAILSTKVVGAADTFGCQVVNQTAAGQTYSAADSFTSN